MCDNGFKRCDIDHCSYFKKFDDSYIILLLYIDDMLVFGSNMKDINELKQQLSKEFQIKDFGPSKQIFKIKITKNKIKEIIELIKKKINKKSIEQVQSSRCKS